MTQDSWMNLDYDKGRMAQFLVKLDAEHLVSLPADIKLAAEREMSHRASVAALVLVDHEIERRELAGEVTL